MAEEKYVNFLERKIPGGWRPDQPSGLWNGDAALSGTGSGGAVNMGFYGGGSRLYRLDGWSLKTANPATYRVKWRNLKGAIKSEREFAFGTTVQGYGAAGVTSGYMLRYMEVEDGGDIIMVCEIPNVSGASNYFLAWGVFWDTTQRVFGMTARL